MRKPGKGPHIYRSELWKALRRAVASNLFKPPQSIASNRQESNNTSTTKANAYYNTWKHSTTRNGVHIEINHCVKNTSSLLDVSA